LAARKRKATVEPESGELQAAASELDGQQEGESDTPDVMSVLSEGFADLRDYIDDRVANIEEKVGSVAEEQVEISRSVPRVAEGKAPERPHRDVNARGAGAYIENYQSGVSGGRHIPVGADGMRIPDYVFDLLKPRFLPGEKVQINRDSQKDGAWKFERHEEYIQMTGSTRVHYEILKDDDGKQVPIMWGEVLDGIGHDGVVTIVKTAFFSPKVNMWKYRCEAPGIGDGQNSGEGFWDYELMPVNSGAA
jgi:hypothetical protein